MKISIIFSSIIFCFSACQKAEIDINPGSLKKAFDLTLEISTAEFAETQGDTIKPSGQLDLERGLMICDVNYGIGENHVFYCNSALSDDSIVVSASLRYTMETNDLSIPTIDIQFNYTESKEKLLPMSDSTFVYRDNKQFYDKLVNKKWDTKLYSESYECNQVYISFPDNSVPWGDTDMGKLNSNGFYFEEENFIITSSQYDEVSQSIEFSANFNVSMKVMSCGFAIFYQISNAQFSTVINSFLE